MPARMGNPVFVLIHSPLVGPTTWSPVADELGRRRREAVVPSLLGVVAAPAPQWRHVPDAVRAATTETAAPVVLVGHSGAGLLLPAITDALTVDVAALVFVDSFLPSTSGSLRLAPAVPMSQLRALASDGVLPRWSSWFGEDAMRELVPEERLRATLEEEMPRLPLSYFEARVPLPGGWSARPCAYLLFSGEPYGKSAAQARDRGWAVAEIEGSDIWRWPATRSPSPTRCSTSNVRSAGRVRAFRNALKAVVFTEAGEMLGLDDRGSPSHGPTDDRLGLRLREPPSVRAALSRLVLRGRVLARDTRCSLAWEGGSESSVGGDCRISSGAGACQRR